ncbi:MAG: SDR family NAD(P)-dependent oxidoreductase, partial [Bacteroidota bacterium]
MQDAGCGMQDAGCGMQDAGCRILVYCAAMSEVKPFLDHSSENLEKFIDVNNRTAMLLVHGFAAFLREQGKPGKILLMSSLAGLLSPVYVSPYAASKAFLISLAKSLYNEFRPHGIGISVCCAGIINTAKFLESKAHGRIPMADPDRVAAYALKNCGKKAVCIHGFANRLNYFILSRMLPRSLASCFVNRAMRKMYPTFGL